jgi:nucleoside-diphosphate-sugar epimerase
MMNLLFGHGYLGSRIARLWREAGRDVTVVTRSPAKAESLRAEGYRALVADIGDPASLPELPQAETVVFAVGYERSNDGSARRTIEEVYAGGVKNVLDRMPGRGTTGEEPGRSQSSPLAPRSSPLFIYISSTGVYGDAAGAWVDERTPCDPRREGGRAALAAEQAIAGHPLRARHVVLRLAGIYGPGRIPRAEALRRGDPIDAPADGYLNLVHVDDAARIVVQVERHARAGSLVLPRTYNVSDGRPGLRREYYAELARLLDAPPPVFVAPAQDSPAAARAAADKRIGNQRLLDEVRPTFLYPSYREGLAAIVAAERASNK